MPRYIMRDTPLRAMERLMMSQPDHKPRRGGIYRSQFHYTPEDVECEYCQNYVRKNPCLLCEGICLEERIEAGVLNLNEFVRDCFAPLWNRSFGNGCISSSGKENLVFSCLTLTRGDGHTGESSAGVCLIEIKPPSTCSRLMIVFGAE